MAARWQLRDLIIVCVSLLFLLTPVARGEPSVVMSRTGPDGRTQHEPVPPGTGLVQVVANGRVVSSRRVDVNAPLRVIVEFDSPPAVVQRAQGARASAALQRLDRFRADLGSLRSQAVPLLVEELTSGGIPTQDITVMLAGGTHPPASPEREGQEDRIRAVIGGEGPGP